MAGEPSVFMPNPRGARPFVTGSVSSAEFGLATVLPWCLVHLVAVASPGPDFLLVTRNTLRGSSRLGTFTALGIMAGNSVHVFYTLFGTAWFSDSGSTVFEWIRVLGALYLGWMGVASLRFVFARGKRSKTSVSDQRAPIKISSFMAFRTGLITSVLNAKAAIYFVSVMSQWNHRDLTLSQAFTVAVILILITGGWFTSLAHLMGRQRFRATLERHQVKIEGVMGVILTSYAIRVLFTA